MSHPKTNQTAEARPADLSLEYAHVKVGMLLSESNSRLYCRVLTCVVDHKHFSEYRALGNDAVEIIQGPRKGPRVVPSGHDDAQLRHALSLFDVPGVPVPRGEPDVVADRVLQCSRREEHELRVAG